MAKSSKRALLLSALAIVLCIAMLIGTTYAWFTDTASTAVNKIVSGKLDVVLEMNIGGEWVDANGKTLPFLVAGEIPAEGTEILWEPGCTYRVPELRIRNNGNLSLQAYVYVSGFKASGESDVDLRDVIDWKMSSYDGMLTYPDKDISAIVNPGQSLKFDLEAHMKEEAGNEYQGLSVEGISITVVAKQHTYEKDSIDDQYDKDATYPPMLRDIEAAYKADASVVPEGFVVTQYNNGEFNSNTGETGTVTIKDAESLLYFAYVLDPAAALANEPSTVWPHTSVWYGGSYARHIVLDADIDLQGITLPNGFGNMKNFTFDGQGHTIKNATINYTGTGNAALFANNSRGISNLVVENVKVIAPNTTNAVGIVSSDANATIDNVTVRNSSVTGGKYTGAIVGYNYGSVTNCTVENCTVTGRYKVGGVIGYICNSNDAETFVTGNTLTGVTVKGENLISGKTDFVIGKIVGNWNATVGTCNNNTFSGTTTASDNIGEVESRCTVTQ